MRYFNLQNPTVARRFNGDVVLAEIAIGLCAGGVVGRLAGDGEGRTTKKSGAVAI